MRSVVGFILGVVATIGVLYFHDLTVTGADEKIVNWPKAAEFARTIVDTARQQVERVIGK